MDSYIALTFDTYLHRLSAAPQGFKLQAIPPSPGWRAASSSSFGPGTASVSSPESATHQYDLAPLTPKFYTLLCSKRSLLSHLRTACLDSYEENRTALLYTHGSIASEQGRTAVSPQSRAASEFVDAATDATKALSWSGSLEKAHQSRLTAVYWSLLAMLGPWRTVVERIYPDPGLPASRCPHKAAASRQTTSTVDSSRRDAVEPYFLDDFVRSECNAREQRAYVQAVILAVLRQKLLDAIGGA